MKRFELLSPAGDVECLKQAVYNGCDAVYLGLKKFGARRFASNFTEDEILWAIKFCHLYGVKIYVTMNTLVKNDEVDEFLEQAEFLHKNGVDALIVQDFGMICLLREMFPNLEIHASTQANISSKDVCLLLKKLGVKRVVFARELSIDEIDSIDVDIEKEVFIHGALCISYSGRCLMSSMLGGRSANRGECAGSCRMPFTLIEDGKIVSKNKYLLSTKELNTTYNFDRLLNSSVFSFKIEGRMKSPLYVGFITRLYRSLIDGDKIDLDIENDKLRTIYNREFTEGRIFNVSDKMLMNTNSPNHLGLKIGKIIDINQEKIKIKLDSNVTLHQFDAIRFLNSGLGLVVNYLYDMNKKLVNEANGVCYVDNKLGIKELDIVSKTSDIMLEREFISSNRLLPLEFKVVAKLGDDLIVEVSDGEHNYSYKYNVIEEAKNSPISEESVKMHLSKLGNTPFYLSSFTVEMDSNIFIRVGDLNKIRRSIINNIICEREKNPYSFVKNKVTFTKKDNQRLKSSFSISCFVRNKEQLNACLTCGISRIYVDDKSLYEEYKNNKSVYLKDNSDSLFVHDALVQRNLISNYGNYTDKVVVGDYSLNVYNIYTAYYLYRFGYNVINLSLELDNVEISEFLDKYYNTFSFIPFEVLGYGRCENMFIKGNVLNLKSGKKYLLLDYKMRRFPVYYDGVKTHILNHEIRKFKLFDDRCCIRLDFYDESGEEVKNIVKHYL